MVLWLLLLPFKVIGALLVTPVVALTFLVLYLYRLAIIGVARIFRRNYASIVAGLDAYFLVDRPYELPHFSLSPCITIANPVDVNEFRRRFLAAIQPRTDPGTCRLFQYPVQFGGFHFWKWDPDFRIDRHIVYVDGGLAFSSPDELHEHIARDMRTPYERNRPLWKITIIPQDSNGDTLIVFKFHHAIMDAFAFFELIQTRLLQAQAPIKPKPKMESARARTGQQSWFKTLVQTPAAIQSAHAELKTLNDSNLFLDAKRNAAAITMAEVKVQKSKRLPPSESDGLGLASGSSDWVVGSTERFALSEFKPAREILGVSTTALFLAAMASGLETYMQRYVPQKQRPASIHFLNPFPPPDGGAGRPERTLGNYFTMASLEMNLAPGWKLRDQIKGMHTEFQRSARSPFTALGFQGLKLLGILPACLQARAAAIGSFTCIFSNIAGPSGRWNFFGQEVTDFRAAIPLPNNNQAFGFMLVSYNGRFRIVVTADRSSIPTQVRMDELCDLISSTLNAILVEYARIS